MGYGSNYEIGNIINSLGIIPYNPYIYEMAMTRAISLIYCNFEKMSRLEVGILGYGSLLKITNFA